MEYLDTYDENKNFLGSKPRDYVHQNGLWHNTVHCWLYDTKGNIYFQIRSDEKKFYTTASGHVLAGETVKQAFGREIQEEIGANIDYENAKLMDIVIWKSDKQKPDGTVFKDRAFANVYVHEYNGAYSEFNFNNDEVDGVVKVNAKEALQLFEKGSGKIEAEVITNQNGENISTNREIDFNEFLVQKHETALSKYGDVLRKVIELTESNK